VFGYAKMHQNKSKNINIISNEIIKYANDNNEESLDVLDNFKNFDNLNKNKQTEYINIIKPLINQYGQSAIFFIEEHYSEIKDEIKKSDRGINESVLVFGYAKMHQNKSKNINIISNEIIKYANDNNEESLDVLDNFKNFDNLNKNKQTEYINIIKPLINQYGQSAIFFIEEHYSEIKDEIKKRD
jgi:ligand-binding sensor protein